ncbi:hypothetical protein POM88_009576 [Heracleum sosnowskyi]|uniref:Uncharacterized protein n=1 Tax=Heracleum sosnowskyi TaxID=360622 RepID=A0AAD8J9E1_9APIA|nr:hypothetical protein POM88_009576 [Heracleum sosnowskyi]
MLKLTIKATRWNTCTSIVPGGAVLIYGLRCVSSGETKIGKRSAKLLLVRAGGGEKAKGTYKGGSISQLQHMAVKESQSQGTPIHWLDVYVETRDGLPDAVNIANTYHRLLDERYPEGIPRPIIDQELWERASIVKKNYVKGQGQKRRPSISGFSCSTQSSQSSTQPFVHTLADCVRAICQNRELLLELGGHLGAMDPEDLARAVAAAAASHQQDGDEGSHHDDRDDEFGGSS